MCSLMPSAIIAAPVEALRVEPAEVAHARQRHGHQAVEELVHARLAQRHLGADRHALAQLEGGDRLARLGDHRLLAGDRAPGRRPPTAPSWSRPTASPTPMFSTILSMRGTRQRVLVAELLVQLRHHHVAIVFLQPRLVARRRLAAASCSSAIDSLSRALGEAHLAAVLQRLEADARRLAVVGSAIAMFDRWIGASLRTSPPCSAAVCF